MPTKLNKAGNQQNYVPQGNGDASGEYADTATGSNIHFTNFKKPDETETVGEEVIEQKSSKDIGVQVKDTGDKPADTSTIKSQYNGKGKEILADALQKRLPNSKNTKYLLDSISDADDELSGVIGDFYSANPKVEIKLGKSINSKYETSYSWFGGASYKVALGQGILIQQGYYSKGGVFFHESGHALDATFTNDGVRDEWSFSYISQKHGIAMCDMVKEEIRLHKDNYEEIKAKIKEEEKAIADSIYGEKEDAEFESISDELKKSFDALQKDEGRNKLNEKHKQLLDECVKLRKIWSDSLSQGENYYGQKRDAYILKAKETSDFEETIEQYDKDFYAKNFPERNQLRDRRTQLADLSMSAKDKAKQQICVKYGDLSDMFLAAGVGDLCGMGHRGNYWTRRHIGNECFAEIISAKATNQASYELMKQYIPKTLEIYEEIMNQIKNKKNMYNKA